MYDKHCRIGTHTFLKTLFQILTDILRIYKTCTVLDDSYKGTIDWIMLILITPNKTYNTNQIIALHICLAITEWSEINAILVK